MKNIKENKNRTGIIKFCVNHTGERFWKKMKSSVSYVTFLNKIELFKSQKTKQVRGIRKQIN